MNIEKIKSLKPDLIIANKEENVKEQIEQLQNIAPHVWVSDINNVESALHMIKSIGELVAKGNEAKTLSYTNKICIRKIAAFKQ